MTAVAPLVESWARNHFAAPAAHLEPLASFRGQFSRVQRLAVHAGAHDEVVYVKTFITTNGSAEERARQLGYLTNESERLLAAARAFQTTPWLRVPRLLASLPDDLTIVTTEVEGEPLGSVLARAAVWRTTATLQRACLGLARAGEWLRRFQQVPIRDDFAYLKDYRAYLDDRLRILVERGRDAFTERHRAAALAAFDRHAAQLEPADWWPRPAHGDFCPANILVTDSAVSVLDLAMSSDRVRYLDLAHLNFHLELLARRLPLGARMLETLQHALLEGFGDRVTPASPLFRALMLQHAICYMVPFVSKAPRPALERWRLRRRVGWALRLTGVEV